MRPGRPEIRTQAELDRAVHAGKPVLVELYSNFCLICMATRQAIRQVHYELGDACVVTRIELPTVGGREIAEKYRILYTPSFLFFDEHGDLLRMIVPDTVTPLANGYRVLDANGAIVTRLQRVTPEALIETIRRAA